MEFSFAGVGPYLYSDFFKKGAFTEQLGSEQINSALGWSMVLKR